MSESLMRSTIVYNDVMSRLFGYNFIKSLYSIHVFTVTVATMDYVTSRLSSVLSRDFATFLLILRKVHLVLCTIVGFNTVEL